MVNVANFMFHIFNFKKKKERKGKEKTRLGARFGLQAVLLAACLRVLPRNTPVPQ